MTTTEDRHSDKSRRFATAILEVLRGAVLQAPGVLLAARASTGDLGAALELAGLVLRRRALPVEVAS